MDNTAVKSSTGFTTKLNGNHAYKDLIYGDHLNKICFLFSPRAGCTIVFQSYLDLIGLLKDGLNMYDQSQIHHYRCCTFVPNVPQIPIQQLIDEKYMFIKFIMNPYIRAVSIFRAHRCHNLTFRQFMKDMVSGETTYLTDGAKYHCHQQYMEGEEKVVTKYVRVNEYDTYTVTLHDDTDYVIDVNKYTSSHHGLKGIHTNFCGDIHLNDVQNNLPASYKYFYDDEIKALVYACYGEDIRRYEFTFPF